MIPQEHSMDVLSVAQSYHPCEKRVGRGKAKGFTRVCEHHEAITAITVHGQPVLRATPIHGCGVKGMLG